MDKMKDKLSSSSSKKAGAVVADPNLPRLGEKGKPAAASASKKTKASPGESGVHVDNPAQEDADGVLLDVFLFGAPVPMDLRRWRLVKSLVSGRLVNGYCRRDWALRYIYPLTSANVRVSGLMPVCDKRTKDELRWREAELARQREARMRAQEQRERDVQLQQVQQQQLYPQQVEMAATSSTGNAANLADTAANTTSIPPPLPPRRPSVSVPADAMLPPPITSAASSNAATAAVPLAQPTPRVIEGDEASLHGTSPGGAGGNKGEGAEDEEEEADADGWEELLSPNHGDDASAAVIDPAEQADELEMLVRPDDVVKASPEPSTVAQASAADAQAGSIMPAGGGGSMGSAAAASSASSSSASASRAQAHARSSRIPPLPCVRWGGIESFDVTALVNGHKDYPRRIELLLRACGYQP